jgi:stress response protein YsnF
MPTNIIGVFDDAGTVRKVTDELLEAGFRKEDIDVLEERDEDALIGEVVERGIARQQARAYAEAVRRGKKLLAARSPDDESADEALAIMERYESSGDDEEEEEDSSSSERGNGRRKAAAGGRQQREETVREVQDEVEVGKRRVASGGVRVTSTVTEKPVQKTVTLREEEVEVERRDVKRELSPGEAEAAFEEKTLEMTETSEEAGVEKTARVVGEVSLRKEVNERKETVRDTVRRTEVDVERLEPGNKRKGR